jgi:hypothetical protein
MTIRQKSESVTSNGHSGHATLQEFCDAVFHAQEGGETTLGWSIPAGRKPGYPMALATLLSELNEGTHNNCALYFGTGTMGESDGQLRNRQSQFEGLHVLVLDDIGTKVVAESLPVALQRPTYIIESSQGNFQYGYVLDEPIRNLGAARALVAAVYGSGYTDAGGNLPNKLVRLPAGVNGKPKKEGWNVRLVQFDAARRFTPTNLLDASGADRTWEQLQDEGQCATGAFESGWNFNDEVADWLHSKGLVIGDDGDWLLIRCPWCEGHSDGEDTAGYSPIGRGGEEYRGVRGFNCFHDHCNSRSIRDFLAWVGENGGPTDAAACPLDLTEHGRPKPSARNLGTVLRNHPVWEGAFSRDEWSKEVRTTRETPCGLPSRLDDAAWHNTCAWLTTHLGMADVPKERLFAAIEAAAKRNEVCPCRDEMDARVWDGEQHIRDLVQRMNTIGDFELNVGMVRRFVIGSVAVLYSTEHKPVKMDSVLLLIGAQGVGKTETLRRLFGDAYSNMSPPPLNDKDFKQALAARWLIVLDEMAAASRAKQEVLKNILTMPDVDFRPPYGRNMVKLRRHWVFAATTNDDKPLNDPSGGRRFLPVRIGEHMGKESLDWISDNRDQIWAEAKAAYELGEPWFYEADSETARAVASLQEVSRYKIPAERKVEATLMQQGFPRVIKILALQSLLSGLDQDVSTTRIASVLRAAGFKSKHNETGNVWKVRDDQKYGDFCRRVVDESAAEELTAEEIDKRVAETCVQAGHPVADSARVQLQRAAPPTDIAQAQPRRRFRAKRSTG